MDLRPSKTASWIKLSRHYSQWYSIGHFMDPHHHDSKSLPGNDCAPDGSFDERGYSQMVRSARTMRRARIYRSRSEISMCLLFLTQDKWLQIRHSRNSLSSFFAARVFGWALYPPLSVDSRSRRFLASEWHPSRDIGHPSKNLLGRRTREKSLFPSLEDEIDFL